MRRAEIITAVGCIAVGGIAISDAIRLGFGYERWGPEPGFLPFWLGVLVIVCGAAILIKGLLVKTKESFFLGRPALISASYVALTSALFCVLMAVVGTYIATAAYAALFSAWLGKHRWYSVLVFAILTPVIIYFGMERGLLIPLPKSPVYARGWLPF